LLPNLRQREGFKSYHGGFDAATGRLVAVSMWDTREQAEGITSVRGPFQELGVQFEPPEVYEVAAQAGQ
jgi:hypothetical protein